MYSDQFEEPEEYLPEDEAKYLREQDEAKIPLQAYENTQWVHSVIEYSSQYSASWQAQNICGESNTYPNYGDQTTAWAPREASGSKEHLILEFKDYFFITGLWIYETYNPGAVFKISCLPIGKDSYEIEKLVDTINNTEILKAKFLNVKDENNDWNTLYEGDTQQLKLERKARIFNPTIDLTKSAISKIIRIDMDCTDSESWSEIDAVKLIGVGPCFTDEQQAQQQENKSSASFVDENNKNDGKDNNKEEHNYVNDLKFIFNNQPSSDCCKIQFPIRKKTSLENNLFVQVFPKIYYIHEFLLRYRINNVKFLEQFIVKDYNNNEELEKNTFSLTEMAASYLIDYLYTGQIKLSLNKFKEENSDYDNAFDFIKELQYISEVLNIDNLLTCCNRTLDIINQIQQHEFSITLFNLFSSSINSGLYEDMKRIYQDTCTKGEDYIKETFPDLKLIFSMGEDEESTPLTPSSSPCIYVHSSILKSRCTFFKTLFDWKVIEENPFMEDKKIKEIVISDVKYNIFLLLIKDIYTGSLKKEEITPDIAIPLFIAQNQYLLDSSLSLQVIKENLSENNVLDILNMAIEFSFEDISEFSHTYLLQNIETNYLEIKKLLQGNEEHALYQFLISKNPIWDLVINKEVTYVKQWVKQVNKFSSEYTGWPADNIVGASNTYPEYGDLRTAWAPSKSKGAQEYLELEYDIPVYISEVRVYETYNPGSLYKITIYSSNDKVNKEVIYDDETKANVLPAKSRIFIPTIDLQKSLAKPCNILYFDIDTTKNTSWYEIDAVLLCGFKEGK
ncbi:hypothetical protein ABK040_007014 [Willaertia magna]